MRRSTTEDAERLADFHALVQIDPGQVPPNMNIHAWIMDLMDGSHPTFDPGDFLLVEDTATGEIASSMCLISQVWAYGGVPIKVGQPELVRYGEVTPPADDPPFQVADTSRLNEEVGWHPSQSLADGIAETIAWWRQELATSP